MRCGRTAPAWPSATARSCRRAKNSLPRLPDEQPLLGHLCKALARGHERDFLLRVVLQEPPDRYVDVLRRDFHGAAGAPRALGRQHGAATAAERLEHDVGLICEGLDHELGQYHREDGRVIDVLPDLSLVPHDADYRIGDAEVLRRLSCGRPAADLTVLAAHRRRGSVSAQMRLLSRELAGDDLVRLATLAVEMEHELKTGREASRPVTGHARPLVPDIPREASPAGGAHPLDPGIPVRDELVVPMDQAEVDQHLCVGSRRQVGKDAAHESVPVGNATAGVVPLVAIGW